MARWAAISYLVTFCGEGWSGLPPPHRCRRNQRRCLQTRAETQTHSAMITHSHLIIMLTRNSRDFFVQTDTGTTALFLCKKMVSGSNWGGAWLEVLGCVSCWRLAYGIETSVSMYRIGLSRWSAERKALSVFGLKKWGFFPHKLMKFRNFCCVGPPKKRKIQVFEWKATFISYKFQDVVAFPDGSPNKNCRNPIYFMPPTKRKMFMWTSIGKQMAWHKRKRGGQ